MHVFELKLLNLCQCENHIYFLIIQLLLRVNLCCTDDAGADIMQHYSSVSLRQFHYNSSAWLDGCSYWCRLRE